MACGTISTEEIGNIEKLCDISSFDLWNFQITVLLKASGLYKIVSGQEKLENLTKDEDINTWIKNDAKAQRIIISTIDKKGLMHIMNCKTAADMYRKLCAIYKKDNEQQKCNLLQEFFNFTFEKGNDMSLHISKLENLAYRLKILEQDINDDMLISKILSTLPERYRHFRTAWESAPKEERTLTNLTARLIAEEGMNKNKESIDTNVAFNSTEKVCYKCSKKGHIARFCQSKDNSHDREIKCFRCGKPGHLMKDCRMKNHTEKRLENTNTCKICKKTNHTESSCYFRTKQAENSSKNNEKKVSFLTEEKPVSADKNLFVIDSGCTSHMVNDIDLFKTIEKKHIDICVAKKNTEIKAKGVGIIENETFILNGVLYVPELSKNLLSVNAITENQGEVIFSEDKVSIMKNKTKVLEGTKNEKGLYVVDLNANEENQETSYLAETKEEKVINWHRKLGHLNINSMKKLIKEKMTIGIDINENISDYFEMPCEICLQAKQVRFPFDSERTKAKRPLELIHTDLCGPIEPNTWDGKNYILTILDDYTHYTVSYLLKHKNEVPDYLKEYIAEMEANKNLKVSKIRSDNGGEYINNDLIIFCKKKGIVMDTTIPHTPQLNGKAERLNRTLMEKARALIFDAKITKSFWGEAVRVATYILNRSPTQSLGNKTPFEMWTGKKPDLSRMQIFGSEAYAKTLGYLKKLDERSEKYLFIGYAINGYRLWDEEKKEVKIRRDVIFKKPIGENMKLVKKKMSEDLLQDQELENIENETEEDKKGKEIKNQNEIQQENEIEYIYEQSSSDEEERLDLGEGQRSEQVHYQTRRGRKVKIPERLKEYELNMEDEALLTYQEAITGSDKEQWVKAINEEKESLNKNQTWTYVDRNAVKDKKILTSKWVFRIKDDQKYKARLVIKGCQQKSGIDYKETFSPVVNISSLRILFALAVKNDMTIVKFDIKTAFLYGSLSEDIFMYIPESYENDNNKAKICHLKKSLYGLKQAPLKWNERFTGFLKSNDLIPLKSDQCMFRNKERNLYLAIYVDDGILIAKSENELNNLIINLKEEFEITVCENPDKFLGIEIKRQSDMITLNQDKYVQTTLEKFNMKNSKPAVTPMISNDIDPKASNTEVNYPYREAVESLLYLTNKTRPDISYAVNFCSRRMENPTNQDVVNIKRIFRYLVNKKCNGICFKKDSDCEKLIAYCDSDFAGDTETRKSTTGYIIFFCDGPISWCSRKQPIVSLSSTEAEYIAAADCVKELLFLKSVIEELTGKDIKIELNIDNQSAITIIKNGQFNRRSKHIDVRFHFINEKVHEGTVTLKYCATERQVADIFTKPLGRIKFDYFKGQFMYV